MACLECLRTLKMLPLLLAAGLACGDSAGGPEGNVSGSRSHAELVVCGWDEVFILRLDSPSDPDPGKVWSWRAADAPGLPDSLREAFGTTDECKPVDGGSKILVTSSGGGVALVERAGGRAVFWATAPNAHSAEMLPGGRVAVAASHSESGPGDRLIVFDLERPGRELCSAALPWGHGIVWDSERELLWALSGEDIRVFRLTSPEGGGTGLEMVAQAALPEGGGHDFSPVPGTSLIALSTSNHCWLFDRETREFSPHPALADEVAVKCISYNPRNRQLAWVRAEPPNWWSDTIRFLNPDHEIVFPGNRFYKVRWLDR